MPYPEMLVAPMREELVRIGFHELRTPGEVDEVLQDSEGAVVVVNSVCGCAAGSLRPAVAMSLAGQELPAKLLTVFAGQDLEATERVRSYLVGYRPSSPSVALLKNGEAVWMLERHHIEGRGPLQIAEDLKLAYRHFFQNPSHEVTAEG